MENKDQNSLLSPNNQPSSKNLTLPPIGKSTITPSSLRPFPETDHSKRTIETEFGTIIVDGRNLTVESENVKIPTAPPSTAMLLGPDNTRPKESVLITCTTSEQQPPSDNLDVKLAIEQSRREDSGMWQSDVQMMAFALSSFMSFRCAVRGPRLWMQFNGGAFTVAFVVCQVVFTMPLFLLEAALGQFTGHGMAGFMPQMAPALRGFPNTLLFCLVVKLVFWMDNLSTVGIYVIEAFEYRPCWMNCNESFHSEGCYTPVLDETCRSRGALMFAIDRCVDHRDLCQPNNASLFLSPTLDRLTEACVHLENGSTWINDTVLSETRELAAAEYYYDVQRASDEKHVHAHGRGILSLLGCWMLLALACQGGWDLVFYTLPLLFGLPACIALAIMINELLLVKDFSVVWDHLVPSVKHLSNYQCWLFAATSSLLSSNIGVGFNSLIFARNAPKHDCLRSAFILVFVNFLINSFWSLSCTILLARNAAQMGRDLKDLLRDYGGEPDLIMLTSSLGQQAGTSQVWLAFLLLFSMLLGLGTSQAAVLVIETSLRELSVLGSTSTRAAVCLIVSAGFILDTMIYLFHDGPSLGAAVSAYANSYFNIVLALMLVCAVNVTLDAERLLDALSQQLTVPLRQLRWFWLTCWRLLCPLLLLGMFVSSVWHHATHPLQFRGVQLDAWAAAVAVVLAVAPLLLLLVEVFRVYAEFGSADAEELYRPTERWQLGLLPPNKRDSLSGAGSGNRSGSVGAAKSLMTRMYGAISSRWLVGGGSSILRIESRVVPLDTGPGSPQTRTATTGSQQESKQNSEQSSRVATKSSSPDPGQRTSSTTKADGSYEVIASQYGT